MKKACLILLVLSLVFMAVACGSAPAPAASAPSNLPDWINEIPGEDVIWGIGSAKQSSTQMSMETAEQRARVSVARQLDAHVKSMFTDYNLDAGPAGNQASTSLQESVSRTITNMNVSGAAPNKRWTAPDGTFWCRVEYKKSDAKNSLASIIGNQEAAFAQFKAQQAIDMMNAEIDKNSLSPNQYIVAN